MKEDKELLNDLLMKWTGAEPSGNFEEKVWRRIRDGQTEKAPDESAWMAVLARPVVGVAVAAGLLIGVGVGLLEQGADHGQNNLFRSVPEWSFTAAFAKLHQGDGK